MIALGLLTALPVARPDDWQSGDSGRAAGWFPVVGLVIGALTWLALNGALMVFPATVAGVIALVVWVTLTGGLHLDGLADCCDGLFMTATRERRLEVMQDPHTGAFGVIGLILILALKTAALGALTSAMSPAILLAASLARWCALPAALIPPARPGGLGADFASGLRRSSIFIGALLPFGLALILGARGMLAALAGLGAAGLLLLFARARIGGVTGDVFGLLIEVVETVVLLGFVIGV